MTEEGPQAADIVSQLKTMGSAVGTQVAALFLGSLAFAVAMAWNNAVQLAIALWSPKHKDEQMAQAAKLRYSLVACLVLTVFAVALAWLLTRVWGSKVTTGQAKYYGLTAFSG